MKTNKEIIALLSDQVSEVNLAGSYDNLPAGDKTTLLTKLSDLQGAISLLELWSSRLKNPKFDSARKDLMKAYQKLESTIFK